MSPDESQVEFGLYQSSRTHVVTINNIVFYRISRWRTRTGSSNNSASFSDNNVINYIQPIF